ncbi:three-helix bundle dimerization domain-containing protein [Microbacterium sp. ASV49]|uniref:Protein-tyrosine-phosphatase-like N-terminal domain-containing protein n=1 Tax=Microbacterium candidum TaxID=3041922 RepID=A0ABT7MZ03_9MICO|nr:hypothetical protein [Microbacterium sp. ASV49]MDL9979666.1 hypothetical protein [Microbacterium sp. ASV49]
MDQRSEQRALDEAVGRLSERFPSVGRERIAEIVQEEFDSFAGAKVRDYVPVLAENAATDRLRTFAKLEQPRDLESPDVMAAATSLAVAGEIDDEVRRDPFEVEGAKEQTGLLYGDLSNG